jgi:osmotically-inducible protein OsmY
MTDQNIKQTVLDELNWEPSINAAHIGVTARDGVVTMTGHVASYAEKYAAERAVERVSGVRALAEELEVRYDSNTGNGDDDIAQRALQVLSWDVFIPRERVKIKVTKGLVTLTGDLDWQYQKSAAESVIRRLGGVTGVLNEITIKPSVKTGDARDKIKAAFVRNAQIDADDITIAADGSKITLSGNVDSFHERNMAENTAWSAPGVTQVVDLLTVN